VVKHRPTATRKPITADHDHEYMVPGMVPEPCPPRAPVVAFTV
jgi:hypothetical protein